MKILKNEKGITLVIVLILSLVALATISSLIFMITTGTQLSGLQKRYKTSLEAGMGGADVTYQLISTRGDPNIPNINFNFSPAFTTACMTAKLEKITSATNWGSCTNYNNASSLTINPADNTTYDFTIDLGVSPYPTYRAFAKIVDTAGRAGDDGGGDAGNSSPDLGLVNPRGPASAGTGEVPVVSMPYLYTLEVYSENQNNPSERAQLSILYQY
jgi:hypothetical protein